MLDRFEASVNDLVKILCLENRKVKTSSAHFEVMACEDLSYSRLTPNHLWPWAP
jgi:hypothetical protein